MRSTLILSLLCASPVLAQPVQLYYPLESQWILGNQVHVELSAPPQSQVKYGKQTFIVDSSGRFSSDLDLVPNEQNFQLGLKSAGQEYAFSRKILQGMPASTSASNRWWIYPIQVENDALYASPQWQKSLAELMVEQGSAASVLLEMPANFDLREASDLRKAQSLGVQKILKTVLLQIGSQYQWKFELWDVENAKLAHSWKSHLLQSKSELALSLRTLGEEIQSWQKQSNSPAPSLGVPVQNLGEPILLSGALPAVLDQVERPYVLRGLCTVPESQSLKVGPGVQMRFEADARLQIFGSAEFKGSPSEPIIMQASIPGQNWNGIEVESHLPLRMDYVEIRDASTALHGVSSNLWLNNLQISSSKLAGMILENTDLFGAQLSIQPGSNYGLVLDSYSMAQLDSLQISGADHALLVQGQSHLQVENLSLRSNQNALVLGDNFQLKLQQGKWSENGIGVLRLENALSPVQQAQLSSLNQSQAQISRADYQELLRPLGLAENTDIPVYKRSRFKPEIQIGEAERSAPSAWAGSVKFSSDYQSLQTAQWNSAKATVAGGDTLLRGDHFPNRFKIPGWNNKISIFSSRQDSLSRVEFSADLQQNQWNDLWLSPISLQSESGHKAFWFGDYRMSLHDLSMGGDPIFGARMELKSNGDLRKPSLVKWDLFGGEWKAARAIGDREPDVFASVVEQGNAQAQRLGGGTRLRLGSSQNFLEAAWVSLNDTRKSWLRPILADSAELRSPLIHSQHIYVQQKNQWNKGNFEVTNFLGFGNADSTEGYRARAIEQWLNENNIIDEKDTLRILLSKAQPSLALISLSLPSELNLRPAEVMDQLDSMEHQLRQAVAQDQSLPGIRFGPQDLAMRSEWSWTRGNNRYQLRADYVGNRYFSPAQSTQNVRELEWNASLKLLPKWAQKLRGQYREENVSLSDNWVWGWEEGDVWGVQKWSSNPWPGRSASVPSPRYEFQHQWENRLALSDQYELALDYENRWSHQLQERSLRKDTSAWAGVIKDPAFQKGSVLSEYQVMGQKIQANDSLWQDFVQGAEFLASVYQQRWMDQKFKVEVRAKWNKIWQGKWSLLYQLRSDWSRFGQMDPWMQRLNEQSLAAMGYLPGGDAYQSIKMPVSLQWNQSKLPLKLDVYTGLKSWKRLNELQQEHGADLSFKWNLVERRLSFEPMFHLRYLRDRKQSPYAYFGTGDAKIYRYYSQDSTGLILPQLQESANSSEVQQGLAAVGYTLYKQDASKWNRELDLSVVPVLRLRLTDLWSMQIDGTWERHSRPDALAESYDWWRAGAALNCNF